jgi:hypothetical protein
MHGDQASQILERINYNLNLVSESEDSDLDVEDSDFDEPVEQDTDINQIVSFFENTYPETKAIFESFNIELSGIEVTESGIVFLRSRDVIPEDLLEIFIETYPSQIVFVPKGNYSIMARVES